MAAPRYPTATKYSDVRSLRTVPELCFFSEDDTLVRVYCPQTPRDKGCLEISFLYVLKSTAHRTFGSGQTYGMQHGSGSGMAKVAPAAQPCSLTCLHQQLRQLLWEDATQGHSGPSRKRHDDHLRRLHVTCKDRAARLASCPPYNLHCNAHGTFHESSKGTCAKLLQTVIRWLCLPFLAPQAFKNKMGARRKPWG
jgi:hypothetical protein